MSVSTLALAFSLLPATIRSLKPNSALRSLLRLGPPLAASTRPRLSFYSTESPSPKKEASNDAGDDGVSNEELKMRIDSYYSGNQEALPSIFEAILKRKLAGKDEETDEKLMEEILGHGQEPLSDIDDDDEADSDEFPGSDLEI